MAHANTLREFPEQLSASGASYTRVPGYYAVHDAGEGARDSRAVMTLKEEGIIVYRDEPDEGRDDEATLSAVYRLQPSGPLFVPTGKLFIRFAEGVAADSRRAEIGRAGYEIVKLSQYTPHTAWLRHASGAIAQSLSNIHLLESLADVENVEPQMLTARELRET